MPRFSTTSTWSICISLSLVLGLACTRTDAYETGPEGMQWKLLAFSDRGNPLDSAEILYLDVVVQSTSGDTLALYRDDGFRSSDDSLWIWLQTRQIGDSLEIIRNTPDFLNRELTYTDTFIYHLSIDRMRTATELTRARTGEMLFLDSLIRTDSIRRMYSEVNGIYLRILEPGDTSRTVELGKEVVIHYRGRLARGPVFDDSRRMSAPLRFVYGNEGQIITGLEIALSQMSKGTSARVIIPSRLAFGDRGSAHGAVRPYEPVVYQIEVLDVAR